MNIRTAHLSDAMAISNLMEQLGYTTTPGLIENKLEQFADNPMDIVFVAEEDDRILGVVSCHVISLFHQDGRCGRITSLVIDQQCRGTGIGKKLVEEAEKYFRSMGCIKSEVTSGDHRPHAHQFYEFCGYKKDERRFLKHF